MSYQSLLLAKARKELTQVWKWYEDRLPGLGDRFAKNVFDKIARIEKTPERYPKRFRNYRETMVETFPYLIIYKIDCKKNLVLMRACFTQNAILQKNLSLNKIFESPYIFSVA